jgi:hypothetical protein
MAPPPICSLCFSRAITQSFASKIYLLADYIEKEGTLVALFFSSFFGCFSSGDRMLPVPGEGGGGGDKEERELSICVRSGADRGGAAWHVREEYEHFP